MKWYKYGPSIPSLDSAKVKGNSKVVKMKVAIVVEEHTPAVSRL